MIRKILAYGILLLQKFCMFGYLDSLSILSRFMGLPENIRCAAFRSAQRPVSGVRDFFDIWIMHMVDESQRQSLKLRADRRLLRAIQKGTMTNRVLNPASESLNFENRFEESSTRTGCHFFRRRQSPGFLPRGGAFCAVVASDARSEERSARLGYEEDKRSVQAKRQPPAPPDPRGEIPIGPVISDARFLGGVAGHTDKAVYHRLGGGEDEVDIEVSPGARSVTFFHGHGGEAVLGDVPPEEAAALEQPQRAPVDPEADGGDGVME